jgi:hypothetical protein
VLGATLADDAVVEDGEAPTLAVVPREHAEGAIAKSNDIAHAIRAGLAESTEER